MRIHRRRRSPDRAPGHSDARDAPDQQSGTRGGLEESRGPGPRGAGINLLLSIVALYEPLCKIWERFLFCFLLTNRES